MRSMNYQAGLTVSGSWHNNVRPCVVLCLPSHELQVKKAANRKAQGRSSAYKEKDTSHIQCSVRGKSSRWNVKREGEGKCLV